MCTLSKFVPRYPLGAKSGSHLERLAIIKSDKVDPATKVAPKPTPLTAEIYSFTEKEETARLVNCEKSTKSVSRKSTEICALLNPDLLEDMDACAKLVDGIRRVVCPSSFAKHTTQYSKTHLFAMMQKTAILAVESMFIDQEDTKAAKEMVTIMAVKSYSSA
ncbi:hypothetical protein ACFX16_044092 [Malus domestica]